MQCRWRLGGEGGDCVCGEGAKTILSRKMEEMGSGRGRSTKSGIDGVGVGIPVIWLQNRRFLRFDTLRKLVFLYNSAVHE